MRKKVFAGFLAGVLLVNSFAINVFAENNIYSEDNVAVVENNPLMDNIEEVETTEENDLENSTDKKEDENVNSESPHINYVLVDKPCVLNGETQSIIISLGDGEQIISNAVLNLVSEKNGEIAIPVTKVVDDGLLFEINIQTEQQDIVNLKSIVYTIDQEEYTIELDEIGIEAKYGVNQQIETNADAEVVDDNSDMEDALSEVEAEIVAFDENGNQISVNSIDEALSAQEENTQTLFRASSNVVVVLDPGHDSTHRGAQGLNGLKEDELNFKIAEYCREELQKYAGVTVYMTRNSAACPNPGTSSADDNLKRVLYAKSVKANVYVSIHLNSVENNHNVNGVEVFYPNRNYNPGVSYAGEALAKDVLEQLTALGLSKRGSGIKYRDSEDNTRYDDGSLADYYGVIKNSKKSGFPAIIIEHAFITGTSDVSNYLSNEDKLRKLGVADATGIANYFGLKKEIKEESISVSGAFNETMGYNISVSGLSSCSGVKFAVWSAANGQDDLRWYDATRSGAAWVSNFPLLNHKGTGVYNVHIYAVNSDGSMQNVKQTTFNVSEVVSAKTETVNMNNVSGYFDIKATNISSTYGVKNVQFAVWTKSNQSDLRWYTATKKQDGSYTAHVDVSNHGCNWGNYNVHTYVTTQKNELRCANKTIAKVSRPAVSITSKRDATWSQFTVSAWHVPGTLGKGLRNVKFAVWSVSNGQDDLRWYNATLSGDKYIANIPISNHKSVGTYNIHVYAGYSDGSNRLVGTGSFYEAPSSCNVDIRNVNTVSGTFDVIISNVFAPISLKSISVPIWSQNNQSDIRWYSATRQVDGTYKVHVDVSNHNCNWGKYNVHVYIANGVGTNDRAKAVTVNMGKPATVVSSIARIEQGYASLSAWHVPGTFGSALKGVQFAVWSVENGQDDLRWYNASLSKDQYVFGVSFRDHDYSSGTYNVHAYARYANGKKVLVGTSTFYVDGYPIMGSTKFSASQLVDYYNRNAVYPADYINSDAKNIETFCQMYIEECAAEGIKAEVAFAQAMKETNFLRYGGDVKLSQYNFAGVGATGGGAAGASFPNVRTGIRAQIQHLKAYASTKPLKNSCVDPRFSYVTRGCAPYVEWLGIQENPSGKGWAADKNYGYSIVKNYIKKI